MTLLAYGLIRKVRRKEMPKPAKAQLDQIVTDAIKRECPNPTDFKIVEIGFDMPEGITLYAGFKTKDKDDEFCYAVVEPGGTCKLFDDGEEMVRFFQTLMDRKQSFLQRFSELNYNDLISAFIAFVIIDSFAFLVVHAGWKNGSLGADTISREFLAIVSVMLGFYFGRSRKSES
jgi:hypothetical protein